MSSIVKQSLFAVAILSVAMVEAAPLESSKRSSAPSSGKTTNGAKAARSFSSSSSSEKALKRGKRNVIVEEIPVIQDDDDFVSNPEIDGVEEDVLREQLADLSDEQLSVLAEIVQSQINSYEPNLDSYEIVQLPEYLTNPAANIYEYDGYFPRDRRSIPAIFEPYAVDEDPIDAPENLDSEEVIMVPEEVFIDAATAEAEAEQQDELELKERIAEIAAILNERATRRLRFV